MRATLIVLLGLGALAVGADVRAQPAGTDATGQVAIATEPSGVAVYAVLPTGDDFICQSPCLATFARGPLTLKARHMGLREATTTVKIGARPVPVKLNLPLLPKYTMVTVDAAMDVDEIEVDGYRLFTWPGWVVLPYGEHWAIAKRDGEVLWEASFVTATPRFALHVARPPERPVN